MVVKMKNDKEIRSLNDFIVREIGEGDSKETHIQGYALTFDTISEDLGFRETIKKGALDNCDMSNVVLNFNHNNNMILARNSKREGVGSLVLTVDDKGLFFDAIPTNTTYSRDLIENMQNGIVGKCSFAFSIDWRDSEAQSWDWDDGDRGFDFRTINKIKNISDCSIVVNPAYESTSTSIYKRAKDEMNESKEEKEIENLKRDLELIEISNEVL
jgi:uncharacterized protein